MKKAFIILAAALLCMLAYLPWEVRAKEEKETVRVGYFELTGFMEYDQDGEPCGYNKEYLDKIAESTGWQYEFVKAGSWNEAVEMLRDGRADLLAPAQWTDEREQEFDFSAYEIGKEYGAILTLDTRDDLIYEDFEAFSGLKFGCVESVIFKDDFESYARENGFQAHMTYYKDTRALLSALRSGEIDAAIANLMAAAPSMKILGKFAPSSYYYMVKEGNYALKEKLDAALYKIKLDNTDYENELTAKYFPLYTYMPFTKSELDYIRECGPLRVAYPRDRDPVAYVDESGQAAGITRDILEYISAISGLQFEYVILPSGSITYDYFRDAQIDLISCVEYNKWNVKAPGIRLTDPYLSSRKVIVGRSGEGFDKEEKQTIAVLSGSQTLEQALLYEYPDFRVVYYDTVKECMDAVLAKKVDILIQNQYVVDDFLAKPKYDRLEIVPMEGLEDELCFSPVIYREAKGVADEGLQDSRLISILNKSIAAIPEDEIAEIVINQTTNRPYRFTVSDFLYRYRQALCIIVPALAAIGGVLAYAWNLRRKNTKAIAASERKLKNIAANINGGVVVLIPDQGLRITYANEGFLELIGAGAEGSEKMQGKEYMTYVHPDDIPKLNALVNREFEGNEHISVELQILGKSGRYVPTLFSGTIGINDQNEKELYCVILDITQQVETREKLELEQERLRVIIENSGDILFNINLQEHEIIMSDRFRDIFGWMPPRRYYSGSLEETLELWHVHPDDYGAFVSMLRTMQKENQDGECKVRIMQDNLKYRWCLYYGHPMEKKKEVYLIVGKITDIDAQEKERERLLHKTQTDPLTGFYNKEAFREKCREYLKKEQYDNSAVIFLDLDRFKQVNDSFGHMKGDEAIQDAARKLRVIFSHFDLLSRFGGDEFCILVKDIPHNTLEDKLKWAIEKMKETYQDGVRSVEISASIGVACAPRDGDSVEELLRCADKALYAAKEKGKNCFVFYREDLKLEGYMGREEADCGNE